MSYTPQPGTIVHRAIQHLRKQADGIELSSAEMCEALDVEAMTFTASMKGATEAGLVTAQRREGTGRLLWWRLGDGKPLSKTGTQERDPLPHRNKAPDVQPQPGAIFPGGVRGTEPVPPAPPLNPKPPVVREHEAALDAQVVASRDVTEAPATSAVQQGAPRPFDAWFSGVTGEVVLQGVSVDEDGDVVLTREQVRAVLATLSGVPA